MKLSNPTKMNRKSDRILVCRQFGIEFKEQSQIQSQQKLSKSHWGTPLLEQLKQKGIIPGEHSQTDTVT